MPRKWSFGVAIEAGFELPDFARDQFFELENEIAVDWDFLVGIEGRYRFTDILTNTSERQVGQSTYQIKAVVPPSWAATIYLGWRF